jgi:hypothetical protein
MDTRRRKSRRGVAWTAKIACTIGALAACSGDAYGPPPCRTNKGTLTITATATGCPRLSFWAILPAEVDVGSSVQLVATAAASIGENVAFTWSTADGGVIIANPHAASTTAECTAPGAFPVKISVASADSANVACSDVETGTIHCDLDAGVP